MLGLRTKGLTGTDAAREAEEVRIGYRMLGLGFQVVSEVGAGLLLGWLLQWATGWKWSIAVGGVVGIVVGLTTLVRSAWKMNASLDNARSKGRPPANGGGS
jgi:F0F1-type ATP synthase assembly protein I